MVWLMRLGPSEHIQSRICTNSKVRTESFLPCAVDLDQRDVVIFQLRSRLLKLRGQVSGVTTPRRVEISQDQVMLLHETMECLLGQRHDIGVLCTNIRSKSSRRGSEEAQKIEGRSHTGSAETR
jgi:hypothetical protein